jgi:cell division protein ZapA
VAGRGEPKASRADLGIEPSEYKEVVKMAEKQRVDIEILGQKYPIRSEAAPEYVRKLASFVDGRAREIRGDASGGDPARVLALTALDVADELFRLREERKDQDVDHKDVTARLGALRQLLDAVVPEK